MKRYRFVVESETCWFGFWVTASSRAEAVEKANASFQDVDESSDIWLGLQTSQPFFTLKEDVQVTEDHIVTEDEVPPIPEKALRALADRGYENGSPSSGVEDWRNAMQEQDDQSWMKALVSGDGSMAGIYGWISVRAKLGRMKEGWGFQIHAILYPTANTMGVPSEGEGKHYKVDFQASSLYISDEELAEMLNIYEKKFCDLIYILRAADPEDGLELTEEEKNQGHLQGFMDMSSIGKKRQ